MAQVNPQLLGLVMPDAKILAGVNADQAKTSAFGQFIIMQIQTHDQHLQQLIGNTGFDPTQDLDQVLMAANGTGATASHLTLALGNFNVNMIEAAATAAGAIPVVYNGITILENSKQTSGFAFLNSTLAIAGDVASVKAAIGRQTSPSTLPTSLLNAVNQLSTNEDAWGISQVPPPAIQLPSNVPNLPTVPPTIFQNVQQASGGVKFGAQVAVNAQLVSDSAQDATALANVLQFLLNLGEIRAQQNAQALAALQSFTIAANGSTVNVSASIPEADLEALVSSAQARPNQRRSRAQSQQRF